MGSVLHGNCLSVPHGHSHGSLLGGGGGHSHHSHHTHNHAHNVVVAATGATTTTTTTAAAAAASGRPVIKAKTSTITPATAVLGTKPEDLQPPAVISGMHSTYHTTHSRHNSFSKILPQNGGSTLLEAADQSHSVPNIQRAISVDKSSGCR